METYENDISNDFYESFFLLNQRDVSEGTETLETTLGSNFSSPNYSNVNQNNISPDGNHISNAAEIFRREHSTISTTQQYSNHDKNYVSLDRNNFSNATETIGSSNFTPQHYTNYDKNYVSPDRKNIVNAAETLQKDYCGYFTSHGYNSQDKSYALPNRNSYISNATEILGTGCGSNFTSYNYSNNNGNHTSLQDRNNIF